MVIEIRKVGFENKGAELMLHAILENVQRHCPDAIFAIEPCSLTRPFNKRAELKLYQKAYYRKYGLNWGKLAKFIPQNLLQMYGIVKNEDINVVLDAAGFSYSDQWGPHTSIGLAEFIKQAKKNGTKVILLPQAFGPFKTKQSIRAIRYVVQNVDLIFARERISYEHLVSVVGEHKNLRIAPDFTNLIEGIKPDSFKPNELGFCIIPNFRMIDKTSHETSVSYLPFLVKCTQYLLKKDLKPFILVHEDNDLRLANQLCDSINRKIPIIQEPHPLKLKGIIGMCEGVIGSRYHGLVSALNQGVPSLSTSWSHKYEMLFTEYSFPEGILNSTSDEEEIHKKIDFIVEPESKRMLKLKLCQKSEHLKTLTSEMWSLVYEKINHHF